MDNAQAASNNSGKIFIIFYEAVTTAHKKEKITSLTVDDFMSDNDVKSGIEAAIITASDLNMDPQKAFYCLVQFLNVKWGEKTSFFSRILSKNQQNKNLIYHCLYVQAKAGFAHILSAEPEIFTQFLEKFTPVFRIQSLTRR